MKTHMFAVVLVALAIAGGASIFADDKADPLAELKCPVSGKAINPEAKVAYKDGEVYLCCQNCPKAFEANTAKFAAKANHQLVASGQYVAKACPISGRKINADTAIDVSGVEVAFCCNNCKGKAEKAAGAEQVDLVFNDAAFEKGFEKAKSE